jgi:hypothetical protein
MFTMAMSYARSDVHVNFVKLNNFKPEEITKINKASKIAETILNSQEFKSKVIGHTYNGKQQFFDTNMTTEQVYTKIMGGAESYKMIANGDMDISLTMYYSMVNTIGYTLPDSDTVWLNRKFHSGFDEYEQPSNIVHEWTHKLGFEHAMKWSQSRDYSVPYGVGTIVKELSEVLRTNAKALTAINSAPVESQPVEPLPVPVIKVKYCARSWRTLWLFNSCWEE